MPKSGVLFSYLVYFPYMFESSKNESLSNTYELIKFKCSQSATIKCTAEYGLKEFVGLRRVESK